MVPTQAEIDALPNFSQRWLIQEHLDSERIFEAILAYRYPPEVFEECDRQIEAAFLLGYLLANAEK